MRKICEFFEITESEFLQPTEQLAASLQSRTYESRTERFHRGLIDELFPRAEPNLLRYAGYYHSYFFSLGYNGKIIRSLIRIYKSGDKLLSKSIERVSTKDGEKVGRYITKYRGIVTVAADRLYVIDKETLWNKAITMTILYPSYRSHVSRLTGLTLGSPTIGRNPSCARVLYEYIGDEINIRHALGACGLFDANDSAIPDDIRQQVTNSIPASETVFKALQLVNP
ncbi:MAG: hypothetical protein DHS20C01_06460 [marine bacterium B5-7]|nr:MAG: hypothetical protein DHS20C01_06460 [marine bacterium B5-7]